MAACDGLLLFMSSWDVLCKTRNYCTLLQAVTKRRCDELYAGKQLAGVLFMARTLDCLCSYNIKPIPVLYRLAVIRGAGRLNFMFPHSVRYKIIFNG